MRWLSSGALSVDWPCRQVDSTLVADSLRPLAGASYPPHIANHQLPNGKRGKQMSQDQTGTKGIAKIAKIAKIEDEDAEGHIAKTAKTAKVDPPTLDQ